MSTLYYDDDNDDTYTGAVSRSDYESPAPRSQYRPQYARPRAQSHGSTPEPSLKLEMIDWVLIAVILGAGIMALKFWTGM